MSFDSDIFAHNKELTVLRYRGKNTTLCTEEYILEKYGIRPGDYADFKSLTGDSADNIKGACKVGPKTAAELINSFGGIDDIIAAADMIKKPSIRESIIKSGERLKLNKRLIRLDGGHALPFEKEALVFHDRAKQAPAVKRAGYYNYSIVCRMPKSGYSPLLAFTGCSLFILIRDTMPVARKSCV